jgi:hypothetical protein
LKKRKPELITTPPVTLEQLAATYYVNQTIKSNKENDEALK